MASFAHPNICLFMGACTQPGNFFIVQEFLPGGDVETLLREKSTQLSLYKRMLMAKGIVLVTSSIQDKTWSFFFS